MMKLNCECRLAQYPALLRKALDSAGFAEVPIITNDLYDRKKLHPGFAPFGLSSLIEAAWAFIMLDVLEELRRKIRPYELTPGLTDQTFDNCFDNLVEQARRGLGQTVKAFRSAIAAFGEIPYDRSVLKPRVLVTGEFLVSAHPGSNFHVEEYLEAGGMETIFPRITDVIRREFLTRICMIKDFKVALPRYLFAVDWLFDRAQKSVEKIAAKHPLYKHAPRPRDLYEGVRHMLPKTLNCGEGWLLAAEIVHYAAEGVRSVVILQPFGCLPNHVCGRGMTKRLKEDYPGLQILPLDFDPDTGYANVENRLQMLIMNRG
jgi:predicted nucleotide-binding protein (sugar kinase/HSP70/actin superfamily)